MSHDMRKTVLPGQVQLISSANTKWSWGPTFPTGKGTALPGLLLSSLMPWHVPARHMEEHWPPRGQRLPSPRGGRVYMQKSVLVSCVGLKKLLPQEVYAKPPNVTGMVNFTCQLG